MKYRVRLSHNQAPSMGKRLIGPIPRDQLFLIRVADEIMCVDVRDVSGKFLFTDTCNDCRNMMPAFETALKGVSEEALLALYSGLIEEIEIGA